MKTAASLLILMLAIACSGGGGTTNPPPPPNSPAISYTDPGGQGWRLERDASSTNSHLILALRAPAQGSGRGVWATFQITGPATFSKPKTSDPGFISFGSTFGADPAIAGKTSALTETAGIFVKGPSGPTAPATIYAGQVVLQIAIDIPNSVAAGTPLTLTMARGRHLSAVGVLEDQSIAVGTIAIQ